MGTILTGTKKESKLTVGIQGITNEGGFFNRGDMQVRQQFIVGTNGITNSDRYFGLGDVTCPGLSFIDASITPNGVWAGALEPKVISAKYELFFKDAQGNDVQITKDGAVNAGGASGQSLVPIVWSLPGTLGISDGAAPYHTASKDLTLTDCEMVVKTAPVGGTVSIDIEVDTVGKTGAMPSFATIFSTLPTLRQKDEIYVDYNNVKYKYSIEQMIEVSPDDVSILAQRYDDSYLTLITCTPPGTYLKRLIVRARLVKT